MYSGRTFFSREAYLLKAIDNQNDIVLHRQTGLSAVVGFENRVGRI